MARITLPEVEYLAAPRTYSDTDDEPLSVSWDENESDWNVDDSDVADLETTEWDEGALEELEEPVIY